MENLPPFYVGQKVVALKDSPYHPEMRKGKVFTVLALNFCCCWSIDIGLKVMKSHLYCADCNIVFGQHGSIAWKCAKRFAPLEENFESISLEKVLETETKLIGVN